MKLIVGLGNPGSEYTRTRHNAGWMLLRRLAERHQLSRVHKKFHAEVLDGIVAGVRAMLIAPQTYMNRSGLSVGEAACFFKAEPADILILVDDLALPLGAIRIRCTGGHGGHNGLADIERVLGTRDYPRLRIGVGEPQVRGQPISHTDHVLGRFTDEELKELSPALDKAADAVECWLREGTTSAMNKFNIKPDSDEPETEKESEKEPAKEKPFGQEMASSVHFVSQITERRRYA